MRIAGYGIQIDVPHGWEARISKRPQGDPTLHAGNFPLPVEDGDFGSEAVARMPNEGIFIAVTEYRRDMAGQPLFARAGVPVPVADSDLSAQGLQRTIPGQSGAQHFFTEQGRPFCLYVVVGRAPSPWKLLKEANTVLKSLSITP